MSWLQEFYIPVFSFSHATFMKWAYCVKCKSVI